MNLKDIWISLGGTDVESFKSKIKNLSEFKDIVDSENVTLKKDLTLKYSNTNAIIGFNDVIHHNTEIIVEGIVELKGIEKKFEFTVKIKEISDQNKLDNAISKIKLMDKKSLYYQKVQIVRILKNALKVARNLQI